MVHIVKLATNLNFDITHHENIFLDLTEKKPKMQKKIFVWTKLSNFKKVGDFSNFVAFLQYLNFKDIFARSEVSFHQFQLVKMDGKDNGRWFPQDDSSYNVFQVNKIYTFQ